MTRKVFRNKQVICKTPKDDGFRNKITYIKNLTTTSPSQTQDKQVCELQKRNFTK